MAGLLRQLRGWRSLVLTGAEPSRCLNLFASGGIRFWDLQRLGELELRLCLPAGQLDRARRLAERCGCQCSPGPLRGLPQLLRQGFRRPMLLLGLALALFLTFYLQSFVWVIRVEGCRSLPQEQVRQALAQIGIVPGCRGSSIDSQLTKHRLLLQLPRLSWAAANRSGLLLTVPVSEGSPPAPQAPDYPACHLVAARDGVLTQVSVLEGQRHCAPGDSVRAGQLLVSGFEDQGLYLRAVRAQGEIFAATWHTGTVVTPAECTQKRYTGEAWREISLILGRKRINFSSGSSIFTPQYDKMISVKEWTLPGGERLPLRLEIATCRAWTPQSARVRPEQAQALLLQTWQELARGAMVAGRIESTRSSFLSGGGLYILQADSSCHEMIARVLPAEAIYEGESP